MGDRVEYRTRNARVDVRVTQGPAGPQGNPGPPGSGALSHIHVQSVASATWEIDHPLTFRPTVQITDSSGNVVYPENVRHTSPTHIQVTFSAVFSGEASLT